VTASADGLVAAVVPVTFTALTQFPGGGTAPNITSIVNGASFQSGPVAPGELISIFGTGLSPENPAAVVMNNGRLPTTVSGVQVTFDGTAAPLVYVKPSQLTVVAPFEVEGKTQTHLQVVVNGQSSAPTGVRVGVTAPGVFTTASDGGGQASIINQTGESNAANAPALKGSTVTIFLTGAGKLSPAGTSGAVGAPGQTIVAPVMVNIGGQSATVTAAGSVPGAIQGVYSVQATVPQGSPQGSVPLQVIVGSTGAQSALTMYVQ